MASSTPNRLSSKLHTFVAFARNIAKLSTCKRKQVGAIVFPLDFTQVIAIGYNGPARGLANNQCTNEEGECGCAHAEANAAIKMSPGERGIMFCTTAPCWRCANTIINSNRIIGFIFDERYRNERGLRLLVDAGLLCMKLDEWDNDNIQEWWKACSERGRTPSS